MILALLLIIPLGYYFEAPLLPLVVAAAILQYLTAYVLTKNTVVLRLAVALLAVVAAPYVFPVMLEGLVSENLIADIDSYASTIAWVSAIVGVLASTAYGLTGTSTSSGGSSSQPVTQPNK